jgi:hypothetical protein
MMDLNHQCIPIMHTFGAVSGNFCIMNTKFDR